MLKIYLRNGRSVLLFLSLLWFSSCDKNSNSLKPYADRIEFTKTISFNGTTVLIVEVTQDIQIGPDSLKLKLTNPLSYPLSDIELLYFVKTSDNFDDAMSYFTSFSIPSLGPQQDTTITILSHPELPIKEEHFNVVLLSTTSFNVNPMFGKYSGQVAYFSGQDTVPSNFSFAKGYVSADGTTQFWAKRASQNKTLTGQFIDTIALNCIYRPDLTGAIELAGTPLPDSTNQIFIFDNTLLQFFLNLSPEQNDFENRIKLTLYK